MNCPNCTKTQSKLKQMEIAFEQINNSRNDLIKQLAEQEIINQTLEEKLKITVSKLGGKN